jgi:hypothetical protein
MSTVLDDLWGGYQEGLTFDSTTRTLDLEVSTHQAGRTCTWRLRLTGVRELRVERADDEWERTEVTELHVSDLGACKLMEIVYWAEPNGLSARFEDYQLIRVA